MGKYALLIARGLAEGGVVARGLVGVGHGELRDGDGEGRGFA
jgi:hypothetical protein